MNNAWEIVIGLETHVQLSTASKIFSGSSTAFGAAPNLQANEVDLALPGSLPVMNRAAVERAICFGLAVGAHVSPQSIFARKHYFYPDLPKNYQISQYEIPVVQGGVIRFMLGDQAHEVQLTRAHLEEDAGKSLHEDHLRGPGGERASGIDLNRTGTPLLEIVSEPQMRSAEQAVAYAKALHTLVVWLGICDGNMQEGSFRVDANVSVRPRGQQEFGTRCEIKNVNSFRFLERAILFEARRQIELIEDGGTVVQETRLYDPDRDETRSMRSKEDAHDYRYFPDPDLPPLVIAHEWIEQVRANMPELPQAMQARFVHDLGLPEYDAAQLTSSLTTARYFEAVTREIPSGQAKLAANWVMGEVAASLNRAELEIERCPVSPAQLAQVLQRILDGTVSNKGGREIFQALWQDSSQTVDGIIESRGLKQVSDTSLIDPIIDEVLAANPVAVTEYRSGKEKAFNSLVGQVMKAAKGKANPAQVNARLKEKLAEA